MQKQQQGERGNNGSDALWFERPAAASKEEIMEPREKKSKPQLNSGNVPDDLVQFYHLLAMRRATHISVGVAEALTLAKPLLAEKYGMDRCQQCQAQVEAHHAFCWACGGRVMGTRGKV